MVMNGNSTFPCTSHGQEWEFHILLLTFSGNKWLFHIATDILVVKNWNFTLLLTSSTQEWQFHIATDI